VYDALTTALLVYPVADANALIMVAVLIWMGDVYTLEALVGVVPSVVK